ncbi:MAG: homocysteine S-methyltransferase family protein [Lentimicrobium sp.]|nr:homocysteine S-methyltransferase family protein [Lentimicrobium sp.]
MIVKATKFEKIFRESEIVLTEGALAVRLKSEYHITMDKHIAQGAIIYSYPKLLESLYNQYINIAVRHKLPIMLMTPTRKANFISIAESAYSSENVIADNCRFLNEIRDQYPDYSGRLLVGGHLGCRGDAYSGENTPGVDESFEFHRVQTGVFKTQEIDFLFAGIMPAANEALGMSMAMAETGIPYIISFMIRGDGCLLDGTPISDAIRKIDSGTENKPFGYMTNCVHPTNLRRSLGNVKNIGKPEMSRFIGIQANASPMSPEELNNSCLVHQDDFNCLVDEIMWLRDNSGFRIFGGCCGTDDVFLEKLAEKLANVS